MNNIENKRNHAALRGRNRLFNHPVEQLGFIYIHIPKTGGTSIKDCLGIRQSKTNNFGHETALLMQTKMSHDVWDSHFKFCFVRNPWDRVVSWYEFNHHLWSKMGFDEWILKGLPDAWGPEFCFPGQDNNPQRQLNFFTDWDGDPIVDFIGKFENFEEDFCYVSKKINRTTKLPKSNIGARRNGRDYHKYYTPETRDIVANMFADDIRCLNYEY